ncbi:MAG: cyclase family protein [Trueperaceae bacterium]|nr:MAG: cyclase family protein [Trueperaceae bacterium]
MIDITRTLYPDHPNWPGDTPYSLAQTSDISQGSTVNLMKLETSTHGGTHLDAPYHYDETGATLERIPLELLIGEALIVHTPRQRVLHAEHLPLPENLPKRILFFTGQPERWQSFPESITAFAPDLIHSLADRGVRLIGTDAPSVDALDSKTLPAHKACGTRGITILESLNLQGVAVGRYHLICLPLALVGADASPARAILTSPAEKTP